MRQIVSVNRATLTLLGVCIALIVVVAIELLYPTRIEDTEPVVVEPVTVEVPTFSESVYLAPRMDDLAEMIDRPLFYSDRRMPVIPEPTAAPVAPPTPLGLKLEGVAITAESRIAVLRNLKNNQLLQLEQGMLHEGWTLEAVNADSANFRRGEQVSELSLDLATSHGRQR